MTSMPAPVLDWATLDRHLDRLLDLSPAAQAQELARLAETRPELAAELRRLLSGQGRTVGIEALGASPLAAEAFDQMAGLGQGDRLGDWSLRRRIGSGGMADVFEGERELDGVRQRAAIKILAYGLGGSEQLRRFRQETAILARLDDPRLSRLIDAGTAPDGRPWLAMEYVDGEPIDRGCDRRTLDLAARVRLVINAAMALDHAHRQLVIHRDLKPANILLDAGGKVRLLDFGIAKVLAPGTTGGDATATHARAYTLNYASPEQLAGGATGVASDVYQLGLLLFLLVTGSRPFAESEDDPLRLLAAMRAGAPLASRRLQSAGAEVARARAGTAARLAQRVRGDLDSIIARALEPEPQARYLGARELAEDLVRWLDRVPVQARRYSRSARALRWLRRHWVGAATTALMLVLLLGYAVTVTRQSRELARERNEAQAARQRAEAIQTFLLDVFGTADPDAVDKRDLGIDEVLVGSLDEIGRSFADQPLLAAQLSTDIGSVLLRRGQIDPAERAFREAIALREQHLPPDHVDTAEARVFLAQSQIDRGETEAPAMSLQAVLDAAERGAYADSDVWFIASELLAMLESRRGEIDAADRRLAAALDRHTHAAAGLRSAAGDTRLDEVEARLTHARGVNLMRGARFAEAEPLLRRSVENHTRTLGATNPVTLTSGKSLAAAWRMLKQPERARDALAAILAAEREIYSGPHPQISLTLGHLANATADAGDPGAAAALWLEAAQESARVHGAEHAWIATAELAAARNLLRAGRREEAVSLLQRLAALQGREDDLAQRAAALLAGDGTP